MPGRKPRGRPRELARLRGSSLAKITRPQVEGVLARTRLFRALDQSARRAILWVAGPPGAGKTTLVASYLAARRLPVLWYQVDGGDADPATFFYYLGLAAAQAAPRGRKPLPLLTPEYLRSLSTFARRYFQELYARLTPPCVLVFDNYQEVRAEGVLHEVMREGLAELPAGIRVVLVSREVLPPAFSRFRVNRTMDMLGWEELRLTPQESRALLRLRARQPFGDDTLHALHALTDGWAAGLVLMAERLATEGDAARSLAVLAPQEIFDYFAGELFLKSDGETQEILLQTAFLPRMTAGMAESLTGSPRAGRILADLSRKNYFTARRAEPEPVYEYHPLFRQFLLSRVAETVPRPRLLHMQRTAAALLEASGQVEGAAPLLADAADWAGLARLVGTHAPALLRQGRNQTLQEWLHKVPREILQETPWLLYWLGVCRLPFDLTEARGYFEAAYARFTAGDEPSGSFLAWAGVVETFVYEWGNFAPLDRWIAELEALRRRYPAFPSPEIEARVAAGMFCALIYRQTVHPEVPLWEQRVRAIVLGGEDARLRMTLAHHLLLYHCWWDTDMGKADLLMDALRPAAQAAEIPPLARIAWHASEAAYGWMKADHVASLAAVEQGLEVARAHGVHLWDFMLCANGAWAWMTSGQPEKAGAYLRKMAALLNPARRMDAGHYHFLMCLDAWHRNDPARGADHVEAARQAIRDSGVPWAQALLRIARARVLVTQGEPEQAADLMARAHDIARQIGNRCNEYLCLVTEAQWALERGDEAAAVGLLPRLMAIGRQQGYWNYVWWHQGVMARLCVLALEHGIEVDYVQQLVRRRGLVPEVPPVHVEHWPWAIRVRTLGAFEVCVDDRPIRFSGKTQRRPMELLKALIAFGGTGVREERLAEALWPEAEGDAAHSSLKITLHRLRRLLGHEDVIQRQEGGFTLDARTCWVDTWALQRDLSEAEEAPGDLEGRARLLERALALYRGPFLAGQEAWPWAEGLRERLRGRLLRQLRDLAQRWEQCGAWSHAVTWLERALELDRCAEETYRRLMLGYQRLGRRAEALEIYEQCRRTLRAELGVEPSPETAAVERTLRGSGPAGP